MLLHRKGAIGVLVIEDAADAVPLTRALIRGGIELTLRTPVALIALTLIRAEVTQMLTGVGTVLTLEQAGEVKAAGPATGQAPVMTPPVFAEARRVGLSFAPGVCTPTDIDLAIERGCRLLKFFPSEPSGRLAYRQQFGGQCVRPDEYGGTHRWCRYRIRDALDRRALWLEGLVPRCRRSLPRRLARLAAREPRNADFNFHEKFRMKISSNQQFNC